MPDIAEGRAIWSTAITEPNAGSDIFGQKTTARKNGQNYIITGSKQFITNGTISNYVLVMCRTNPDHPDRLKRHGFFIVKRGAKGFESTKLCGKLGIRASDTAALSFEDVEVPAENLLGEVEGQAFAQVMHLFNINRVVAAAQGPPSRQQALVKVSKHGDRGSCRIISENKALRAGLNHDSKNRYCYSRFSCARYDVSVHAARFDGLGHRSSQSHRA
ncbi:MAG: acyl-CoA dehydrogenase [Pseudomonadota bacterium]